MSRIPQQGLACYVVTKSQVNSLRMCSIYFSDNSPAAFAQAAHAQHKGRLCNKHDADRNSYIPLSLSTWPHGVKATVCVG